MKSKSKEQKSSSNDSGDDSDHDDTESSDESARRAASRMIVSMRRPSVMAAELKAHHYGSFYLRMGAVGKFIYHFNNYLTFNFRAHLIEFCRT